MNKERLLAYLSDQGFAKNIVDAFATVIREDFVPKDLRAQAYANSALPLGGGSTISQPYTIAFMLELLELAAGQKILEIGSGSGYVLALINQMVSSTEIYGLEINKDLVNKSQKVLRNYKNIRIILANGSAGYLAAAPYDRILISASATALPQEIYQQLAEGGILVCPIAHSIRQIKKLKGQMVSREFPGFVFVSLRD